MLNGGNVARAPTGVQNSKVTTWLIVLLVLSLLFQLAGFVTPGWMSMKIDEVLSLHLGLWYTMYCGGDIGCHTIGHGDLEQIESAALGYAMREYQIETSLALVACIFGIVLFIVSRRNTCESNNGLQFIIGFLACALSGILALVASGKFADGIIKAHNLLVLYNGGSPFLFSYSLLLTGIGGILAGIAALVVLFHKTCGAQQELPGQMIMMQQYPQYPQYPQAGGPVVVQGYTYPAGPPVYFPAGPGPTKAPLDPPAYTATAAY